MEINTLENILSKGEISPNKIILKNKDLEHRLDINYKNNGAEFIEVKSKKSRLDNIITNYNQLILNNEYLDYEILLYISILSSYTKKGFNAEYISSHLNNIESILDTLNIFKNEIYKRVEDNKKIYPFFLSLDNDIIVLENVYIEGNVMDNFNNSQNDIKKIFYYMYEVEINEMYNNLLVKQNDLILYIKKIIGEFENKLSQKEKDDSNRNKKKIEENIKKNKKVSILDLYDDDRINKWNNNYLPKIKKNKKEDALMKIIEDVNKTKNDINNDKIIISNDINDLKREKENTGLSIYDEKKLEKKINKLNNLDNKLSGIDKNLKFHNNKLDIIKVYSENIENNFGAKGDIESNINERKQKINNKIDQLQNKVMDIVNKKLVVKKRGIVKSETIGEIRFKKKEKNTLLYIVIGLFSILFLISYFNKK